MNIVVFYIGFLLLLLKSLLLLPLNLPILHLLIVIYQLVPLPLVERGDEALGVGDLGGVQVVEKRCCGLQFLVEVRYFEVAVVVGCGWCARLHIV